MVEFKLRFLSVPIICLIVIVVIQLVRCKFSDENKVQIALPLLIGYTFINIYWFIYSKYYDDGDYHDWLVEKDGDILMGFTSLLALFAAGMTLYSSFGSINCIKYKKIIIPNHVKLEMNDIGK